MKITATYADAGETGVLVDIVDDDGTARHVAGDLPLTGPFATLLDGVTIGAFQGPALASVQAMLCADIDRQAEAQRVYYVTDGSGQAMVYLQKQTQAAQALTGLAASPAMTAAQGAAAFVLLAAEIGITADPTTKAPATDVFGVARAVAATVTVWLPIAAAIERARLSTKAAIGVATTAAAAQAAHDAVAWPAAPTA